MIFLVTGAVLRLGQDSVCLFASSSSLNHVSDISPLISMNSKRTVFWANLSGTGSVPTRKTIIDNAGMDAVVGATNSAELGISIDAISVTLSYSSLLFNLMISLLVRYSCFGCPHIFTSDFTSVTVAGNNHQLEPLHLSLNPIKISE